MTEIAQALGMVAPFSVATAVNAAFDAMAVAEKVMKDTGAPSHTFALLRPGGVLEGPQPERLLEHHMVEIANRVAAGDDTRLGTKAECLVMLSQASLKAPLNATGSALAGRLAREVMGQDFGLEGPGPFPGALDELLDEARSKASQSWRK